MRLLGRRAYSRGEVIQRLIDRGHDKSIATHIADELETDRWIDDAAYARAIVHEATRTKPAGRRLLLDKLKSRRIDAELAQRVAEESASPASPTLRVGSAGSARATTEFDAALALARKRLDTMRGLSAATIQRRLAALLARRGFEEDAIQAVIERLPIDRNAQE